MNKFLIFVFFSCISLDMSAQKIKWIAVDSAFNKNSRSPKKIFTDVYTDWCYWCKVMEKTTFTNKQVIAYINKHFYAVRYNAEDTNEIRVLNQSYKPAYQNSKYNELAINLLHGQLAFPSFNFTNEKNETIAVVPGYWKSKKFLKLLIYIAKDYYISYTWQEFDKKYKLKELLDKPQANEKSM